MTQSALRLCNDRVWHINMRYWIVYIACRPSLASTVFSLVYNTVLIVMSLFLIKPHSMRAYGDWRCSSTHS